MALGYLHSSKKLGREFLKSLLASCPNQSITQVRRMMQILTCDFDVQVSINTMCVHLKVSPFTNIQWTLKPKAGHGYLACISSPQPVWWTWIRHPNKNKIIINMVHTASQWKSHWQEKVTMGWDYQSWIPYYNCNHDNWWIYCKLQPQSDHACSLKHFAGSLNLHIWPSVLRGHLYSSEQWFFGWYWLYVLYNYKCQNHFVCAWE